mgnify:CR=1 FL=1
MNDVIFQGGENKSPLNLAEVNLTFSNKDKSLDIDYDKVVITRRIFRDGENEYKINGKKVRLKDIRELFLDTGIGKEGYTLIGQGRIEEIISSSNLERRAIFEEASGISKHKYRRDEASKKLDKVSEDLEIIEYEWEYKSKDLVKLKNEAENYKKWQELSKDLDFKSYSYFKNKSQKLIEKIDESKIKLSEIEKDYKFKSNKLDDLNKNAEPFEIKYKKLSSEIELYQNNLRNLERNVETAKKNLDLNKQKLDYTQKDLDRISANLDQNDKKVHDLKDDFDKENKNFQEKKSLIDSLKNKISTNEDELNKLNESISKNSQSLANKKSEKEKLDKIIYEYQISSKTREILEQKRSQEDKENQEKISSINEEIDSLEKDLEDQKEQFKELSEIKVELRKSIVNLNDDLENKNLDIRSVEKSLNQNNINLKTAINEYKFNKNLIERNEGYFYSVSDFLNKTKANNLDHLYEDTLANLIKIKKGYEEIIDNLIGSGLQNIVTRTKDETRDLINFVNRNHLGRITFLPIDSIKSFKKNRPNEPEVMAMAYELIDYNPNLENIISHFLGSTVVVKNIDQAISLSKKISGYRIITLDLDVINSWGSMAAGSNKNRKSNTGILNRKQKLEENKLIIQKFRAHGLDLEKNLKTLNIEFAGSKDKIDSLNSNLDKNQEKINNINTKITNISYKIENLSNQKEEIKGKLSFNIEAENEVDIKQLNQKLTVLNEEILELEDKLKKCGNKKNDLSLMLATEKNSLESHSRDLNMLTNTIARIKDELENLTYNQKYEGKSKAENQSLIENIKKENDDYIEKIKDAKTEITINKLKLEEARKKLSIIESENQTVLKDLKILEDALSNINIEKVKLEYSLDGYKKDYQNLEDEVEPFISKSISELEKSFKDTKIASSSKSDLLNLQKSINNIGYFTEDSLKEYEKIQEEFEFTNKQLKDLKESKDNIIQMIDSLESEMKEEFKKNFEVINEKFARIFQTLFMGGEARLKLDDEDELLAGVDIIARPPSKSFKSISLLSGGEKSLTAVALLFAIFETNPAPFAILDEIDAALDETNIRRYIEYLKLLSENSQFIMITHRQTTMQLAEKIHGITIDDDGVSQIYSIAFDKNWKK